jgi:hypothetical protein
MAGEMSWRLILLSWELLMLVVISLTVLILYLTNVVDFILFVCLVITIFLFGLFLHYYHYCDCFMCPPARSKMNEHEDTRLLIRDEENSIFKETLDEKY